MSDSTEWILDIRHHDSMENWEKQPFFWHQTTTQPLSPLNKTSQGSFLPDELLSTDFSTAEVLLCILMPKSVMATDILSVFPGNKDTFQAQFHNCMLGWGT